MPAQTKFPRKKSCHPICSVSFSPNRAHSSPLALLNLRYTTALCSPARRWPSVQVVTLGRSQRKPIAANVGIVGLPTLPCGSRIARESIYDTRREKMLKKHKSGYLSCRAGKLLYFCSALVIQYSSTIKLQYADLYCIVHMVEEYRTWQKCKKIG